MRRAATKIFLSLALVGAVLSAHSTAAEDLRIWLIVHPSRAGEISRSEARAIYLKQQLFWQDGKSVVPINREAGSTVREAFSMKLFGRGSRRLAAYWNQRYFEAGEFPPATLASEEAVVRFVAENPEALGYVATRDIENEVAIALSLE